MKNIRIWIICLLLLALIISCIEGVLGQPIFKFVSLQIEYLFLPRYSGSSDEVLFATDKGLGQSYLQPLNWTEEDIARLKALNPKDEGLGEYRKGVFSPSGNIVITFANQGARIRDRKGNLITDALISAEYWSFKIYFRQDEQEIIFSSHDRTSIWTSQDNKVVKLDGWEVLGYSPDERFIIADGKDGLALLDRTQAWTPRMLTHYDRVRGFAYRQDQQYLLTYGCIEGIWFDSGYFCFHGGSTLWDREGHKVIDFTGQDEGGLAGFTQDMQHVVIQGCDRLWTLSRDFPIINDCLGSSTRYYDLQGHLEGVQLERDRKILYIGYW